MPMYKQAADGHCYINTSIRGNFVTFQLHPDGAQYLYRLGFGKESDFDWVIFRHLSNSGWLSTLNRFTTHDLASESRHCAHSLILLEKGDRWQLHLVVPPLDFEVIDKLPRQTGLRVNNDRRSAPSLQDGWLPVVAPLVNRFRVFTYGDWGDIDHSQWTKDTPGLNIDGNVFAWRQNEWLLQRSGHAVRWGETILVVCKNCKNVQQLDRLEHYHQNNPYRVEPIGELENDWKIFQVVLPIEHDSYLQNWFRNKFEISVLGNAPQIEILTPAVAFVDDRTPVFARDQKIYVRLSGINANEKVYYGLKSPDGYELIPHQSGTDTLMAGEGFSPGSYDLFLKNGYLVHQRFRIAESIQLPDVPEELRIQIGDKIISGIQLQPPPLIPLSNNGPMPEVRINNPFSVRWRTAFHHRSNADTPEMATIALERALRTMIDDRQPLLDFYIDADAYGQVHLHFVLENIGAVCPETSSAVDQVRFRWLAELARTKRSGRPIGPNPAVELLPFEHTDESAASVPWHQLDRSLAPHLARIAKLSAPYSANKDSPA